MELTPEMEGDNPHFTAERTYMGENHKVYVHLLIATQFGIHYNEMNESMRQCVVCNNALSVKKTSGPVFQLWARVMGGIYNDKWEYVIVFMPGCHACKSSRVRRYSLLVVNNFEAICKFIDEHAFQNRHVEVDNFLAGDSVFAALVDSYLFRFTLINSQLVPLYTMLFGNVCFRCKNNEPLKVCEQCKCIRYCIECKDCVEKHHANLCHALQRKRLFHTDTEIDSVYYVERNAQGRHLLFKPKHV